MRAEATADSSSLPRLVRDRPRLILLAVCALLYLPGLGGHDLWNPDEPRYAEVTREMLASGELLVPHLNGEVYTHKPPLMFWAMALASLLLGGLTESAVRLPSALAAIGTVQLTYALGRRLFDDKAGFLAALALATCAKVLWQARVGQIDMLLCLLVTLTAYLWTRADLEDRPALYLAGFGVAGLGTLAKGPVALLPLLLGFLVFHWMDGGRKKLVRMRVGRGVLLWAAVVAAWLAPAALSAGGSYLDELVVTQNLTRYSAGAAYGGTRGHLHPWYYYPPVLALEFLPWSLFLPVAGRAIRWQGNERQRRAARLLLCWAAATVLFFSLSPAKRSVYVLQMYPAMALLVGGGLGLLRDSGRRSRLLLSAPLGTLALAVATLAGAVWFLGPARPEAALLPSWFPLVLAAGLGLLAAGTGVAAWFSSRGRLVAAVVSTAAGIGALMAVVLGLLPALDPLKSVRPVAEVYRENAGPGEPYGFFPGQEPALHFYTGRVGELLESEDDARAFLERPGTVWLFVERGALDRIAQWQARAEEVARGADPEKGYVLLVSRKGSE